MGTTPVVSFLITGLGQGGAETQLVALARYLNSCGWDVEVSSLLSPTRFVAELEQDGIGLWSPGTSKNGVGFLGAYATVQHLRARQPDVLCTFMFHANILGRVVGRLTGVPVIVSSIRNELFGPRWRERVEALTQRLCDRVVVNSEIVAQSLVSRGVVPISRLRVIPNWIDHERFLVSEDRLEIRRRLGVHEDQFFWLAVGRLESQKDYPALLQAIAMLYSRTGNNFRLGIAGDGPLREMLIATLKDLGLENMVSLLGLRDDVPLLFHAADGLVLSSRWEGSPNAVLEALAAGVPIVATDVGGVRELVQQHISGLLVPADNPEELAAAMQKMMDYPTARRIEMGGQGRRWVCDRHGTEATLARWEELLRGLIGQRISATNA